eukprot:7731099-Alexandrium_andersonii.AAC.1
MARRLGAAWGVPVLPQGACGGGLSRRLPTLAVGRLLLHLPLHHARALAKRVLGYLSFGLSL